MQSPRREGRPGRTRSRGVPGGGHAFRRGACFSWFAALGLGAPPGHGSPLHGVTSQWRTAASGVWRPFPDPSAEAGTRSTPARVLGTGARDSPPLGRQIARGAPHEPVVRKNQRIRPRPEAVGEKQRELLPAPCRSGCRCLSATREKLIGPMRLGMSTEVLRERRLTRWGQRDYHQRSPRAFHSQSPVQSGSRRDRETRRISSRSHHAELPGLMLIESRFRRRSRWTLSRCFHRFHRLWRVSSPPCVRPRQPRGSSPPSLQAKDPHVIL